MSIMGLRACAPRRASRGTLTFHQSPPPCPSSIIAFIPPFAHIFPSPSPSVGSVVDGASLEAPAVRMLWALAKAAKAMRSKCAIASTVKAKCHFLSLHHNAMQQEKERSAAESMSQILRKYLAVKLPRQHILDCLHCVVFDGKGSNPIVSYPMLSYPRIRNVMSTRPGGMMTHLYCLTPNVQRLRRICAT